jgi:hypothetical protein
MYIRKCALIGLLLTLEACGVPTGMAALSYTMNGISYASSGKGLADHALSAATEQDCAVLRVVQGGDICESSEGGKSATLMTMIDSAPGPIDPPAALTGQKHSMSSVPTAVGPAKPVSATDGNRSVVALESIYGHTR